MSQFEYNLSKKPEDELKSREERFLATMEFFKRIDLQNIVEDPKKKSEFIKNLSFDEFQNFLLRVNGIQRNTPTSKRVFNTGKETTHIINLKKDNGEIVYCPPSNSDKIMLLQEAFDALKRMDSLGETKDSALMIGCAINAIHPFEDGNGRTARSISMMLASSKENFLAPQANPEAVQPFIENYLHNLHKLDLLDTLGLSDSEIEFPKMSDINKKEFFTAVQDDLENFLEACQIFTKKENDSFKDLVISPKDKMLSLKGFLVKYGNRMDEVMHEYHVFKNEYVRVLVDVFEHPKNYCIKDVPNIFNRLPTNKQKVFANMTFLDIFYNDMKKDTVEGDKFSWDYLINFIKGEVE